MLKIQEFVLIWGKASQHLIYIVANLPMGKYLHDQKLLFGQIEISMYIIIIGEYENCEKDYVYISRLRYAWLRGLPLIFIILK